MTWDKATPHCTNRLQEWCCAVMQTQLGILIVFSDVALRTKPQLAFQAIMNMGLPALYIGFLLLGVGVLRLVALWQNGMWNPRGPIYRAAGAGFGMVIWSQLFYGICEVWWNTGDIYLSFAIWNTLAAFELVSFLRALRDIKPPRKKHVVIDEVKTIDPAMPV